MIIVMKAEATQAELDTVVERIEAEGLTAKYFEGSERRVFAVLGDERKLHKENIARLPGVDEVMEVLKPYKLVSREGKKQNSVIDVGGGVKIGGDEVVLMAGPCSIESRDQIMRIAREVKESGAKILRGGAFKWRTSPHSFQGLGIEGLKYIREAKEETGLLAATEVLDPRQVEVVAQYTDILQVGTVSMQNYPLLREVGRSGKPVILKRGKWATYKEFLLSAEYIASEGNDKIVLCERGIRTFVQETRHTMDINAIPYLKQETHLPIIADPSHATGVANLVSSVALASIAAGADGLLIETHYDPKNAATDAKQTISTPHLAELMQQVKRVAQAIDRDY